MAFNIDKAHSEVGFGVKHMMISTVRGKFTRFDADVQLDPAHVEAATVTARVEAGSIDTGEEKRDGHLRSADFFDAEKYPTLTFTSTSVKRSGEDLEVAGNLKIKDQEHPVTLKGELTGPSKDPWGNVRVGLSLTGELEREKWGLGWNQALEAGGVLVGKKVKISIEAELVQSA
ncbi:MAG: polyisoprenoid-binding protein [Myxococcales bacterium]|nr:MAG: polyisoprenoid-binding protein [Myxococcales bacterium]